MYVIVGLGNPDQEYEGTRHNVGRDFVEHLARKHSLSDWKKDKKKEAISAKGDIEGAKAVCVLPETYMNESGRAVRHFVASIKAAERLIVVHDELYLPLGKVKISFGSGAGGHKGVESIQRTLKTKNFIRIRVGISASTSLEKLKKPDDAIKHVLGKFRPAETEKLKKSRKLAERAVEVIVTEGLSRAMTEVNSK